MADVQVRYRYGRSRLKGTQLRPIREWFFYENGSGDDVTYNSFEVNATTMALYRYGYF